MKKLLKSFSGDINKEKSLMKKLVYNFVVLTIVSCTLTLQAYYITLFTKDKQQFALDSDLLSNSWMKEFNYPNDIECPTNYSDTFVYIHTLLTYRSKNAHEKLITYLSKNASSLNEYQVADILNTLAFLKLDTLLDFVLWHCPLAKEQAIVNLCSNDLYQKFDSFLSYLSIKIPLKDGLFYPLNISANKAWRLPSIQTVATHMGSKCEIDYLIKEPIEIVLPHRCIPVINTDNEYNKFFDIFFDTILYLSLKKDRFDDPKFFRNLFEKPLLQSEQNVAAFCNLFDFFEVTSLLDDILEYIGFHLGNKAVLGNDCQGFNPLSDIALDGLLEHLSLDLHDSLLKKCEIGKVSRQDLIRKDGKFLKDMLGEFNNCCGSARKENNQAYKKITERMKETPLTTAVQGNLLGAFVVTSFIGSIRMISYVAEKIW